MKNIVRLTLIALAGSVTAVGLFLVGVWLSNVPPIWRHPLVTSYWWVPFSALYTIGSILWTIRAERLLRRLRTEQRIQMYTYNDLRQDVDDIEGFLESEGSHTLRRIPIELRSVAMPNLNIKVPTDDETTAPDLSVPDVPPSETKPIEEKA
jgi:hypothetical protein